MKQAYTKTRIRRSTLELIAVMNGVLAEYARDGYVLTVRQLYYQMIAQDLLPDSWIDEKYNLKNHLPADTKNTIKSYKNLASILVDARLNGLVDWDMIEDRTRSFSGRTQDRMGADHLHGLAEHFERYLWGRQPERVYLIVEKEALAGVFERVCAEYHIPMMAARGYPSVSVIRDFVENTMIPNRDYTQTILHFGDHDPSGLDMTRDLRERIEMFLGEDQGEWEIKRLSMNMDQIKKFKPPPNPAKTTDARYAGYRKQFGDESWELDAFTPKFLTDLVRNEVEQHIDWDEWQRVKDLTEDARLEFMKVAKDFTRRNI